MDLSSDILLLLEDLHDQATRERSHYYTAKVIKLAIAEIRNLRARRPVSSGTRPLAHNRASTPCFYAGECKLSVRHNCADANCPSYRR